MVEMRVNIRRIKTALFIFVVSAITVLTGCSDLIEVQDREFVLAMGVSVDDRLFDVVFASSDFKKDTKKEGSSDGKNINSYTSSYLKGIEEKFNHTSDKRLDYRHLAVIILDDIISNDEVMLSKMLEYIKDNYEMSSNVLVFYYNGDIKDIFSMEDVFDKSIGEYIKKLDDNNRIKSGIKQVTIGSLINAFSLKRPVMMPVLEIENNELKINGAAVFNEGIFKKLLSEEEYKMSLIAKGEGRDYIIYVEDEVPLEIKKVKSSYKYEYKEGKSKVYICVKAEINRVLTEREVSRETVCLTASEYLYHGISGILNSCIEENLDLLKLYDTAAIKERQLFIDYAERRKEFLNDVDIVLCVEVKIS